MTRLQELKKKAKELGLKGYSTMSVGDLHLLVTGERVPKKLRKNQVCRETQTDFRICNDCGQEALFMHLSFKAVARERKVIHDGELEFDVETGELVGCEVDYGKRN